MIFPLLDDFVSLSLDQTGGLHGLVVLGLTDFTPFLILDILGHPTLVTVPVALVELVDGVGIGVVAVNGIRTDLLFFAGV